LTVYSPSRLSTFDNCPKQFEFRYIQKIQRDTESIEAFVGKRVHEVLERLYHHVARHSRPPSLRQVLDRYRADWRLRWHEGVEIIKQENDTDHYLAYGARCLENYYRSHYPFEEGETVAIEENVQFKLDTDGRYRGRGIIDRLVRRRPCHYEIHDYKTGSYLPPQSRLDSDRQLALYQIGIQQTCDDAEQVDLVWHYLSFNRTVRSSRSEEQLDRLRSETIDLIERIEATREFQAKPGPLCRWCEYRDVCPDAKLGAPEPPAANATGASEGPPPGAGLAGALEADLPRSGEQLDLL
jgi:putative RecB family exonuclease